MNNNGDIRDDLSALIDGALDDNRRGEVEAALANDPALRAEYERLLKMDALYSELPREAAPANFAEGVRTAIARRENMTEAPPPTSTVKIRPFTRTARRSVFWPLAAAATLLVGFFLWSTMNMANRSGMMLSMNKEAAPAKAADGKSKNEQLYKVRVTPAEEAKPAAPAAAAPVIPAPAAEAPAQSPTPPEGQALTESAGQKQEAPALGGQAPPTDDGLVPLQTLLKEDRERALKRTMTAKQAGSDAVPTEPQADANAPAPSPSEPAAAAEAPAAGTGPQSGAPAPGNTAEQRKVAGRVFARSGAGWVDQAYKGEVLTPLEMDSEEYKALLPTHPPLEKVAELGGTITLRLDGVWRDLKTGRPVAEPK